MANLIPTTWEESRMPTTVDEEPYQEMELYAVERTGWHIEPGSGRRTLIAKINYITNNYGHVIEQTEELNAYDNVGGPCRWTERRHYSRAWLPTVNHGRELRLLEVERITFWTFTPFGDNRNTANTRQVHGYVVYTTHTEEVPIDDEAKEKLRAQGINDGEDAGETTTTRVIRTAKYWREAMTTGSVVDEDDSHQTAYWMENAIFEQDRVDEEWDKWTKTRMKKISYQPGAVTYEGPEYIRKPFIRYELPVPVDPPHVSASAGSSGITITVTGGGATLPLPATMPGPDVQIPPSSYRIYRAKTNDPASAADDDPLNIWSGGSGAAAEEVRVIEDTSATELDGTATDPLPAQTMGAQPHDPEEPDQDDDPDIYWQQIAEVTNDAVSRTDQGHAEYLDTDLDDGGEYSYKATASIGRSDSDDSNIDSVTWGGGDLHNEIRLGISRTCVDDRFTAMLGGPRSDAVLRRSRTDGCNWLIEIEPPDDPQYIDEEHGGTESDLVPAALTEDPLLTGEEIDYSEGYGGISLEPYEPGEVWNEADALAGISDDLAAYEYLEPYADYWDAYNQGNINAIGTLRELGEEIGRRRFAHGRRPLYTFTLPLTLPLFGLEQHQRLRIPVIDWTITGNATIMYSQTEDLFGRVKGWTFEASRSERGDLEGGTTKVEVEVR